MTNGIINVYKEKGFTSHDVVAKLRGILKQKKIGHTGTLDPEATGVLPVCLGNATKLCDLLTDKDKTYEAVLLLGTVTDTQDVFGTVKEEKEVTVSEDEIREAILSFIGEYDQVPPMYSALKVNGKKLYELAREGIEIERKPRRITINDILIHSIDLATKTVTMEVSCSKGTYIRTLCHDIGEKLGCGGCMKALERTKVSQFVKTDSLTLSQIEKARDEGQLASIIKPVDEMFPNAAKVYVKEENAKLILNGNPFNQEHIESMVLYEPTRQVRVYDHTKRFIGLYEEQGNGRYKPVKMFL
ncbi:tRNA pseudouridine synthase B [Lachnospiraceae bacterium KM106-2]|nr:tRNA pseudouridine synthase B [Lachnospiraceae bacterium KM106-2]